MPVVMDTDQIFIHRWLPIRNERYVISELVAEDTQQGTMAAEKMDMSLDDIIAGK